MLRPVFVVAAVFACGAFTFPGWAATPKKKTAKSDLVSAKVEQVLKAEVAGDVDRREQLAATLEQEPNSPPARWQSGFVKDSDAWRSFDETPRATGPLNEYRRRRETAPLTALGQIAMAHWCRANKLPDQERAHLSAALELGAGDKAVEIAQQLGYRPIAGRWIDPEQLLEWNELNSRALQSLKRWESPVRKLADRIARPAAQREQALASFKKIADNSAIPAIEYVLAGEDETSALVAVDLLRSFDGFEASLALARQAVFSPWEAVRDSACKALAGRPLDHFVPDLLSLLTSSVRSEVTFFQRPESPGVLYYNMILSQETENQFRVAVLTSADRTISNNLLVTFHVSIARPQTNHLELSGNRSFTPSPSLLAKADRERAVQDRLHSGQDAVLRQNELIAANNHRVSRVLSLASGEEEKAEPEGWWRWWANFSDVDYDTQKYTTVENYYEEHYTPDAQVRFAVVRHSCFAAGTPVWTESGQQAIETIKVGDRVLSQDVESGELAYRPVVRTTVRQPKELTKVRLGNETLVCTGGHRFWSSGSGWVKSRDLSPHALLHTVTGNAPVSSVNRGGTAETYNLVVADFHTYFVGQAGILCQDLRPPKLTNRVVPGLAAK